MTALIIRIADIHFIIKGPDPIVIQETDQNYQPFLEQKRKGPDDIVIHIRTKLNGAPNITKLSKIFSADQGWSMYLDAGYYLLAFHPIDNLKYSRIVQFNYFSTDVTVYCNEESILNDGGWAILPNPIHYPLDQILLMHILTGKKGALLHAAGLNLNGKGCIFPGKSGAGKSTIIKQFVATNKAKLLTDDRIIVRKIGGAFKAHGTPWPGETGIALNESMPLSGIFFINHGSANRITAIKPQKALERLFPVTSIPWYDREIMPKILDFCEDLVLNVPAYELDFKPSVEVVDVFEKFVLTL